MYNHIYICIIIYMCIIIYIYKYITYIYIYHNSKVCPTQGIFESMFNWPNWPGVNGQALGIPHIIIHLFTYIPLYVEICMNAHKYSTYTCVCVCIYINICLYIYTYIYIDAYTCTEYINMHNMVSQSMKQPFSAVKQKTL